MIVYGHRSFTVSPAAFLRGFVPRLQHLPASPPHDDVVSLLVDFGEMDAAVADALQPERDDELLELTRWRQALSAIAGAVCASWAGDDSHVRQALDEAARCISVLTPSHLPARVDARVAEGFAQYGLFPEQYIAAAERFARETTPARVLCIGIRSIGSPLAAIVAAALKRCHVPSSVRSVRPRGHPWDRHVELTDALAGAIVRSGASHFAIVDEGPGLSGTSFAAAAEALAERGVAADRIVLFPSWRANPDSLRSSRGRAAFEQHPQMVASFEDTVIAGGRFGDPASLLDLSAGRWRATTIGPDESAWPAVQPQHERRKYLRNGRLLRFAGLGRHGAAKRARADTLAGAGFTPAPIRLEQGFLERSWIDGRPRPSLDGAITALRIAEYLSFLRTRFTTTERAGVDDLAEMIRVNAGEADLQIPSELDRLAARAVATGQPAVAVDGRLLPHEWIESGNRLWKADALDHHADDFLPGCRDIAWDVAGALVEANFDADARTYLLSEYTQRSGDDALDERLPFYLLAYTAYRLGYATMAAETLGATADDHRFRQAATRYRRLFAARAPRPG